MTDSQLEDAIKSDVVLNVSALITELAMHLNMTSKYREKMCDLYPWHNAEDGESAGDTLEHLVVTEQLAQRLEASGECVVRDFCGLTIWARTEKQ